MSKKPNRKMGRDEWEDGMDPSEDADESIYEGICELTLEEREALSNIVDPSDPEGAAECLKDPAQDEPRPNEEPGTRIEMAIFEGNFKELKRLVQADKTVVNEFGWHGQTPLMVSASHGEFEAVEYLVQNGADLDSQDNDGSSALVHAISQGRADVVQYLLFKGANPNLLNDSGETALMEALYVEMPSVEIVRLLLECGAEVEVESLSGERPIDVAFQDNNPKIIRLFEIRMGKGVAKREREGIECSDEVNIWSRGQQKYRQ